MNGRNYRTFNEIDPNLFRDLIKGSERSAAPEQASSNGIMLPRRPPDAELRTQTESFTEQEGNVANSVLADVARNMGRNADDPERVAQAVTSYNVETMGDPSVDLGEYENLPPLDTLLRLGKGDQTRAALGSSDPLDRASMEGSTRGPVPVSQQGESSTEWNATTFTRDILGRFEGTEAHASLEGGRDTAAYGVKFSQGLNREDFDSDLAFAAAVAQKHYDSAASRFSSQGRNLSDLPASVQNAIVDLHYNVGSIGSTAEKETPVDMMRNTLDFIGATTADGTRGSVLSLARRRAENWNSAAADLGVSRISSIEQVPTNGGTEFRYLDADGNVVHRTTTSRTPITFTGGTSYEVNTDTRRVEIE